MARYVGARLLAAVPTLLGVTLVAFAMLYLMPGDPVALLMRSYEMRQSSEQEMAAVRDRFGLNDPLPVQYVRFVVRAVQGDLGMSILKGRPVRDMILEALPYTAQLAVAALAIAVLLGVTLGVFAAVRHNSWLDTGSMVGALFAVSMPEFWLSILVILLFAVNLRWLPAAGSVGLDVLVLPAAVLGARAAGSLARLTRSSLLEVLHKPFVVTARAKGLLPRVVVTRHALRNALIPVVTYIGIDLGRLLGGAVVVETIFARQGIGKLLIDSILDKDFFVLQGTVLFVAVSWVLINLVVDLSYGWLDPRIRFG